MAEGRVARHESSPGELESLRAAIARDLADAKIESLSLDNRFGLAYEAALLLARMAIAHAGYRVKGQGAHQTHFLALPVAMGAKLRDLSNYFDHCRRKRNIISYEAADVATETEVRALLRAVKKFRADVEEWIESRGR